MDTAWGEEAYGESNMETCITMCKLDIQWEFPVWLRELKLVLGNNLEGWDGEGMRGDMSKSDWFIFIFARNQYNTIKHLSFNLKIDTFF